MSDVKQLPCALRRPAAVWSLASHDGQSVDEAAPHASMATIFSDGARIQSPCDKPHGSDAMRRDASMRRSTSPGWFGGGKAASTRSAEPGLTALAR